MRVVLDTYVLVSGVLFTGPPRKILTAWRDGRLVLLVSPEIFEEYQQVGMELASPFKDVNLTALLELVRANAEMVYSPSILPRIQEDLSDNKFLGCALAGRVKFVVSLDKHLLRLRQFQGIQILRPREFFQTCLKGR